MRPARESPPGNHIEQRIQVHGFFFRFIHLIQVHSGDSPTAGALQKFDDATADTGRTFR